MTWLEVSVVADLAAVEAISALFEEYGEGGVAIDQPFFTDPEGEHFGIDSHRPAVIKTYLPDTGEGQARLTWIREGLWHLSAFDLAPIGDLRVRGVAEEDWANAWKEHYHPLRVGRLLIKPSWRPVTPDPGVVVVEIDPGMAFGTGIHQTTRMCLAALERLLEPGSIVIDQGTGSGILALAAAKLGAARVLARDTAEVAVEATIANAALNGLSDRVEVRRVHLGDSPHDQVFLTANQPPAGLILANIVANVLINLGGALAAAAKPNATMIASGIIRERASEVEAALAAVGFSITERLAEDEWVTLVARRRASRRPDSL
ncbi:MAG TPA: 50S ribosomal protein L11 methyltransferase [Chloroflexota bacterium]|nr:50S ribosomal protein L11 methyltransferase [Chloroflexota bacterium]